MKPNFGFLFAGLAFFMISVGAANSYSGKVLTIEEILQRFPGCEAIARHTNGPWDIFCPWNQRRATPPPVYRKELPKLDQYPRDRLTDPLPPPVQESEPMAEVELNLLDQTDDDDVCDTTMTTRDSSRRKVLVKVDIRSCGEIKSINDAAEELDSLGQ